MQEGGSQSWLIAFALIYLTFFLDNVLLTVLVPIIPDWVGGSSLAEWGSPAPTTAPLARVLNATVHRPETDGWGKSQALVGLVLSGKALAQLLAAAPAAALVCRRGAARALLAGTALLLLAALVFAWCSVAAAADARLAACVAAGAGRAVQGAGAALCGVAGLGLGARVPPPELRARALGALLGAVALGVLVGYPFGGATYALWSPEAPFLIIAAAILVTLVLQWRFLRKEEYNRPSPCGGDGGALRSLAAAARAAPSSACAGAVLLSTCVMAALEPCLPLWIMHKFHPQRWVSGAVFVPDSAAYALAASVLGGVARAHAAEPLALAGQLCVALAALALPHAASVAALAGPHAALGAGLGAVDAALVPALLARAGAPHRAALLQAAASAAYVLGPVLGGLVSWTFGFESTMRALGVLNLLYAAHLYRALRDNPLSKQWGALSDDEEESSEVGELEPLKLHIISALTK